MSAQGLRLAAGMVHHGASAENQGTMDGHGTDRGHRDVSTTMIYTHVLDRGPAGVRSPADLLETHPGEVLLFAHLAIGGSIVAQSAPPIANPPPALRRPACRVAPPRAGNKAPEGRGPAPQPSTTEDLMTRYTGEVARYPELSNSR